MCGKLRVCLVFNLSQLVGGPSAIKKKKKTYGKSEQQFYFFTPRMCGQCDFRNQTLFFSQRRTVGIRQLQSVCSLILRSKWQANKKHVVIAFRCFFVSLITGMRK